MQSAHQLSSKIDNHMLSRDKAAEDVYMSKFEKNILKRTDFEKRQKKLLQERELELEY